MNHDKGKEECRRKAWKIKKIWNKEGMKQRIKKDKEEKKKEKKKERKENKEIK